MSLVESEEGNAEMEESPDPEEDSCLPYRHHQGEEGMESRGEDYAEEDFMALDAGDTDIQNIQNVGIENVNLLAESTDNSAVENVHSDPKELNGLDDGNAAKYPDTMTVADNFLKEDDKMSVSECEIDTSNNTFINSDNHLFHSHENLSSHESNAVNYELEMQNIAVSSCSSQQENVQRNSVVSETVDLANGLDVEHVVEGSNIDREEVAYTYEEEAEESVSLSKDGGSSSAIEISQHSISPQSSPCFETFVGDVSVADSGDIPYVESNGLATHGGVDRVMQNTECDKDSIPYRNTLSGVCHVAAELKSEMQTARDFSSFPPLIPAQDSLCAGHGQALCDITELVPDSKEYLAAALSTSGANIDAETSFLCEHQSKTSVTGSPDQDEINITQDDPKHSNPFTMDGFSTKSAENSPCNHQNVQPADLSDDIHESIPCANIVHNQQTIMQSAKVSPDLNSSIPAQENNKTVHLEDINNKDNESVLSSTVVSPSVVVNHNNSECRCLDSDINSHMHVAQTCSQDNPSATSHSSPARSHNTVLPNAEEPESPNKSQIQKSTLDNFSSAALQHSPPAEAVSDSMTMKSIHAGKEQMSVKQSGNEDEILKDAASTLASESKSPQRLVTDQKSELPGCKNIQQNVNGRVPLFDGQIHEHNRELLDQLRIRDEEIAKLICELHSKEEARPHIQSRVEEQYLSSSHEADDLYLPQIKVMEHTIAQQQKEIQSLKVNLLSQDTAAKRAIASLQNELKSRINQVTKMYEECRKEKDMIVVRFAESEAKNMEAKKIMEKSEAKVKEVMKDKEMIMNAMQVAKADRQRALSNFETKCIEISNLQKEVEKLKEAISSSDHRIKWFQNKLKVELESHKETKDSLEKTAIKLKEAREETEIIRKDCQAIVKRYQESEEIKSNSLDKELKIKETELRTQMQERNDTEEIHQMLRHELDSLKAQHKDTIEEAKSYKDKVVCLEEERRQNHQMIENYQEIMQRQKTSNAELNLKITSLSVLEEDYKSSQNMVQTLQNEITDIKLTNQELVKDMESCRERESKMLTLQSELSHANAILRSENTNLSSQISTLTHLVEKLKKEVQALEMANKDLRDKCEQEKAKRKEEGEKMAAILADRTREYNDLKQKWEDEIDNSKTLKRRHANNIKDLTRQLHQVHKRLESHEGRGDAGSMGSRTNSNGSLNSLENSSRQPVPTYHPPVQEFPAITEQVEVDKQVLIERIVRLQKSHARKNEKLEFLGEHIQQLLEDIRKKNKVIQYYALREEAGTLSSEDMDANKAKVQKEMQTLLARKGGIMASLYSAQQQDGTMTLDLSLQISRKLQAVLEDTLLKNMTLKESLDTLGEEIARLSQENRQLQLHLQNIEGNLA